MTDDRAFYCLAQSRRRSALEAVVVLAFVSLGLGVDGWLRSQWLAQAGVPMIAFTVLVPIAVMCTLGRSWGSLGLAPRRWARDVGLGLVAVLPAHLATAIVSGAAVAIVLFAGGTSLEALYQAKQPMVNAVGSVSPASVLPFAAFVAVYEEIVFRGFLLGRLVSLLRSLPAAIAVNALVFGSLHYFSQGWLGLVQTAALGAILAGLAVWRRTIWPAIACHAGIDTVGISLVILLKPLLEQFAVGK